MPLGHIAPRFPGKTNANKPASLVVGFPATPKIQPSVAGTSAVGQLAIGDGAIVAGNNNYSIAIGDSFASGAGGIAIGNQDNTGTYGAKGTNSIAIGIYASAGYLNSICIGNYAVDSGNEAVIVGGNGNGVGANCVGIGFGASAPYNQSVAVGGGANAGNGGYGVAVGYYATAQVYGVAVGWAAYANANGAVSIGYNCNNSQNYAVGIGYNVVNVGPNAICIGNTTYNNPTDGGNGSIVIGDNANSDHNGQMVIANGYLVAAGDASYSTVPLRCKTTSATPVELGTTPGASTTPGYFIRFANHGTYTFDIQVAARKSTTGTDYASWNFSGSITREANAAATAFTGTPIKDVIAMTSGAISGGWDVNITADTSIGGLAVTATGQASTNIMWVATVRYTKVAG